MVEVTQADREAANLGLCTPERIMAGELDDHPLVQAFAISRIVSEQSGRLAGLAEAAGIAEECKKDGCTVGETLHAIRARAALIEMQRLGQEGE